MQGHAQNDNPTIYSWLWHHSEWSSGWSGDVDTQSLVLLLKWCYIHVPSPLILSSCTKHHPSICWACKYTWASWLCYGIKTKKSLNVSMLDRAQCLHFCTKWFSNLLSFLMWSMKLLHCKDISVRNFSPINNTLTTFSYDIVVNHAIKNLF